MLILQASSKLGSNSRIEFHLVRKSIETSIMRSLLDFVLKIGIHRVNNFL